MSRILFTGDWHAGLVSWGIDRSDETEKAFMEMAEQAKNSGTDFTVVLGDLTESFRYPGNKTFKQVSSFLSTLLEISSERKVYIIKGNHDWTGLEVYGTFRKDEIIYIDTPRVIRRGGKGESSVLAVPYQKFYQLPDGGYGELIKKLMDEDGGGEYILAAHAGTEGSLLNEPVIPSEILADPRIKHTFLGHVHKHTRISPGVYSCGALVHNTFGEEDERNGAYILDEESGAVADIKTKPYRLETLSVDDVTGAIASGELTARINMLLDKDRNTMIRLIAPGTGYRTEDIEALTEDIRRERGLETKSRTYPVVSIDSPASPAAAKNTLLREREENNNEGEPGKKEEQSGNKSLYEALSVKKLWTDFCTERGKENSVRIGSAIFDGEDISAIWRGLKDNSFRLKTGVKTPAPGAVTISPESSSSAGKKREEKESP